MYDGLLLVPLLLVQTAPPPQSPTPPSPDPHHAVAAVYVPQRVYDVGRRKFSDFEAVLADLARADVVLVGEQHGDPNTHRLQAAMLQGLLRRAVPVTVSLEMFERDVQPVVDDYLAGVIPEEEFLGSSRPWLRYATDYRPLVEMARAHRWPVIAANVPRRLAADVAKSGLDALDGLPAAERALAARDVQCPFDRYFERFVDTMRSHPIAGQPEDAQRGTIERFYFSQCLKDETMAESIAAAAGEHSGRTGPIVHVTGAFHSDFGTGTTERVRRRLVGRRVAVLSILPVPDLDDLAPGAEDLERADYLVYTLR